MHKLAKLIVLVTFSVAGDGAIQSNAQLAHCLTLIDNSHLANGCGFKVNARWSDQGDCSNGNCETTIDAESTQEIYPIDGTACLNADRYPNLPHRPMC